MLGTWRSHGDSSFLYGCQSWVNGLTKGVVAPERVEEDVEGRHLEAGLLFLLLLGLGDQALEKAAGGVGSGAGRGLGVRAGLALGLWAPVGEGAELDVGVENAQ